jgi:hypothetical protein
LPQKIFELGSMTGFARSIFQALPGAWSLRRGIEDACFGVGSFSGTAVFDTRADGALHYQERGELTLGAWRGAAWRHWIYTLEGEALVIRYASTLAELHSFAFAAEPNGGASARHVHFCGADRYEAHFRWRRDGSFQLAHRVTGPAKDYCLDSLLTRP